MQEAEYEAKNRYQGDVASGYLDARESEVKWQREQAIIKELVNKYMEEGDSVLDVPFGTGRFAFYYIERGLQIHGLDISKDMLDEARKHLGSHSSSVNLVVGDAEAIPFPKDSVDYLLCARLLNWVPVSTIDKLLSEFSRVTRSKIILEIRTKNPSGMLARAARTIKENPLFLARRLAAYSLRKVRNALSGLGGKEAPQGKKSSLVIHDRKDIDNLFRKHGLKIVEELTVEEYDSALWWIRTPLQFYVLSGEPVTDG